MATMRCKCGTIVRDDDPDLDYLLMSRREFDVDLDTMMLRGRAVDVWRCWACERLWGFWKRGDAPSEYRPGAHYRKASP